MSHGARPTPPAGARRGLRHRWFARLYAFAEGCLDRTYRERKRTLLGSVQGEVLEIGPGVGANLPYLPTGVRWTGVEPNLHMHPYLERRAARLGITPVVRAGLAEQLDLPDASFDYVIGTLVLCSVEDQEATLREVRRVLRPGGRFLFLEHVAAPRGSLLRRLQELAAPVWRWCADGCRLNRETWAAIEAAGFSHLEMERFRADGPLPFLTPHIAGAAQR